MATTSLEGSTNTSFEIWTDYKNLEYFMTAKEAQSAMGTVGPCICLDFNFCDATMGPGHTNGQMRCIVATSLTMVQGINDNRKPHPSVALSFFANSWPSRESPLRGAKQDIAHEIRQGIYDGATEDAVTQAITSFSKVAW